MQKSSEKSSPKSKSDLLKLSLTLFIIAGVMALLVSLVNNITEPRIALIDEQKTSEALKAVHPDADGFEEIEYAKASVESADGKQIGIDGVWKAKKAGEDIGVCVRVSPKGYGGEIQTVVGVDINGKIVQTQIVSMSETGGIGTKIQEDDFLSQFVGKTMNITGAEDGAGNNSVELISGATKSSEAYLRGINAALTVANECMEVTRDE